MEKIIEKNGKTYKAEVDSLVYSPRHKNVTINVAVYEIDPTGKKIETGINGETVIPIIAENRTKVNPTTGAIITLPEPIVNDKGIVTNVDKLSYPSNAIGQYDLFKKLAEQTIDPLLLANLEDAIARGAVQLKAKI